MAGEVMYGVKRDKYDRIPRVNWSTLKMMAMSPAHYRSALTNPPPDTDAKALGRASHVAVYEPDLFRSQYVRWDGGQRRGKEWDKFRAEWEGYEILTENAHDECMAIAQAVRSDQHAAKYVAKGRSEVTILWVAEFPGMAGLEPFTVECKSRLDFECEPALVDLKTTRDASPDGFAREAWRYSYHVQAAFYSDAYFAATGVRKPYKIVAVEKREPYVVQVYSVPDIVLQAGRETYRALLSRVDICRRENHWPGFSTGEMELSLPSWSGIDLGENDLDEMGLEFPNEGAQ